MYKMAVLDIDGTILNSRGRYSLKTKETIKKMADKNIPVCLCTGRNIRNTVSVANQLNIKTPFMCIDGMVMYDPVEKKIIYENKPSNQELLEILKLLEKENLFIEVSTQDKYYKYSKNEETKKYNFSGQSLRSKKVQEYLWGVRHLNNLDIFFTKDINLYQLIAGGSKNDLRSVTEKINHMKSDKIEIRDTMWENFIFINSVGVRKSEGVKLLCKHYGIQVEEVVAIGDEMNDLDMIEHAGMGVAMGNAVDSVKAVAKYITDTNNNDGAANALIKFFNLESENTNGFI